MKVEKVKRIEKVVIEKEVEEISMVMSMEDANNLLLLISKTYGGKFNKMYANLRDALNQTDRYCQEQKGFLKSIGLEEIGL